MAKRPPASTSGKKKPASRKPAAKKATGPARRRPPSVRAALEKVEPKPVDEDVIDLRGKLSRVAAAARDTGKSLAIEVDPRKVEETLEKLRGEVKHWANKGRYTKVRFKFRGKQLLPDLPFAAVMAAEGLTFYWGGILRALLVNVAGHNVLSVELVNDSEKRIHTGKEQLLAGEIDRALTLFREACEMDRDNPRAHLNLGIGLKLKGDRDAARVSLQKAQALDGNGPAGKEAERILNGM